MSGLSSISVYASNSRLPLLHIISSAKKQYFSEIVPPAYLKPTLPTLPRFRWGEHRSLSFIELQNKAAKQRSDETTSVLQDTIVYKAYDFIEFDLVNQTVNIHGAGTILYEKWQLIAENISFNWNTHTVVATGKKNEAGKIDPRPVFQDAEGTKYIAEEMRYNLQSRRGKARKLFTVKDEALIRAHQAKTDVHNTYYIDDLDLTTCNLARPHYKLKVRQCKFVRDKRIASGPFQFYFDGVPTPLGFFYGLFYLPTPKSSGIIFPQFVDNYQGLGLREGGYYIYFNEYMDLALKSSIYSKGNVDFTAESRYVKRYTFKGSLFYKREFISNASEIDLQAERDKKWQLKWRHETLNNRISTLTAEVDIQSDVSGKIKNINNYGYDPTKLKASTYSKIRYTRRLVDTPYTTNTTIVHQVRKDITNMTLPELSLASSPIYLFRRNSASAKTWYQDIYIRHTSEFKNEISNDINGQGQALINFSWKNRTQILKEGRYGFKHTVPIETNIKLWNYFNLKPFCTYVERWYFERRDYQNETAFEKKKGFYRVWDWNMGAKLNTTIYGTHLFSEEDTLQGIRHRIEPSLGFVYTPDFSKDSYGYFQKIQTNQGEKKYNRFDHAIYGTPPAQDSALLTIEVDNVLEMKVRDDSSSAAKSKKIPIFESFKISTGYDFLEANFPLQDINLGVRTRLIDNLISIEYSSTFDPYFYHKKQRIREYAWQHGQGLGTMTKYALKIGTTLKSKNSDTELSDVSKKKESLDTIVDPTQYVDFDLPWQLSLSYQQHYTYQIILDEKQRTRHLTMDGDFKLSKNWKISLHTTYDLDKKELVDSDTKISVHRDLHCWQMNFSWLPLSKRQVYDFSIGIKAAILKDVKFTHNNQYENL